MQIHTTYMQADGTIIALLVLQLTIAMVRGLEMRLQLLHEQPYSPSCTPGLLAPHSEDSQPILIEGASPQG